MNIGYEDFYKLSLNERRYLIDQINNRIIEHNENKTNQGISAGAFSNNKSSKIKHMKFK